MKKRVWEITLDNGDKFEFFADNRSEAVCHSAQLCRDADFKGLTMHCSPKQTRWAEDGSL